MLATAEQLWDAIYSIYNEDVTAGNIQPDVIAKRIEFKMVEQCHRPAAAYGVRAEMFYRH